LRRYEMVVIITPDVADDDVDDAVERLIKNAPLRATVVLLTRSTCGGVGSSRTRSKSTPKEPTCWRSFSWTQAVPPNWNAASRYQKRCYGTCWSGWTN